MKPFKVVRVNSRRRQNIARNMFGAGWPEWAICHCLQMKPKRLKSILNGSSVWGADTEKLLRATIEHERLAA